MMADRIAADLAGIADPDLRDLLAALPVLRIAPVTSLAGANSARASYRAELRDGGSVKARRLSDPFEAERLAHLTRHLRSPQVPEVLAQRGAAVIEPWIEGSPLDGLASDLPRMSACGALLAAIHTAPPPADAAGRIADAREERRARLDQNMRALREMNAIDDGAAQEIAALASAPPKAPAFGLIHGDFCAANLVETRDGRIVTIDNETLRLEALDYDLARTWYRWPMNADEANAFLDGYRGRRDPADFLRGFRYWAACALVDAAVFRRGAGTGDPDLPLRRLDGLLREGASAPWGSTR